MLCVLALCRLAKLCTHPSVLITDRDAKGGQTGVKPNTLCTVFFFFLCWRQQTHCPHEVKTDVGKGIFQFYDILGVKENAEQ